MEWYEVVFVSALPVVELRGGIPLALYAGFTPVEAYILSVLGNILPVPFLLLTLHKISEIAQRWSLTARIFRKLLLRTEKKRDIIDRYGYPGLAIFVSIPLPVTGAYTGCLLAFILGLRPVRASMYIAAGVIIAGIVVIAASMGVFGAIEFFNIIKIVSDKSNLQLGNFFFRILC